MKSHPEDDSSKNPIGFAEANVSALVTAFKAVTPATREMALRDLFALGCYLRLAGKPEAGTKACICALDGLSLPATEYKLLRQGLFDGHERFLARTFQPHHEVMQLIHDLPSDDLAKS